MTKEQKEKICRKFSTRDAEGKVHCKECPLVVGDPNHYDFRCQMNSKYNRKTKELEYIDHDGWRVVHDR